MEGDAGPLPGTVINLHCGNTMISHSAAMTYLVIGRQTLDQAGNSRML